MTPISLSLLTLWSAACGLLMCGLVRAVALRAGIVNHPNPHVPQHRRPVAYLGGVGIALGLVVAWGGATLAMRFGAAQGEAPSIAARVFLPGALFLVLGVWDDLRVLSPRTKFVAQVAVALVAVGWGCWAPLTGLEVVDGAVSAILVVSFVNAFNMTDVCDGLVSMLAIVGFGWAALLGAPVLPMVLLGGATFGFWLLNRPDATIFLGDAGTHLLGFLAAVTVIDPDMGVVASLGSQAPQVWVWWAALSCFSLPLFELFFLIVVRSRRGVPVYLGSSDHFSLRLQAAGLSKWTTLGVSLALAIALGGAGWWVATLDGAGAAATRLAIAVVVVAGMAGFGRLLTRWDATPRG